MPVYIAERITCVRWMSSRGALFAASTLWVLVLVTGAWKTDPSQGLPSGSAHSALDTTLVDTVSAGAVFIRALPATLAGDSVVAYEALRIPATGWLRDRSFFWRVPDDSLPPQRFVLAARGTSRGAHRVILEIHIVSSPR